MDNNCFVQNNQDILLDLADYDLQEQPEDNSMVAFSQAWYNGAYTLANEPIKSLELYCTMIQFLTKGIIANSVMRASLVIYHFILNTRSWNNCKICCMRSQNTSFRFFEMNQNKN